MKSRQKEKKMQRRGTDRQMRIKNKHRKKGIKKS